MPTKQKKGFKEQYNIPMYFSAEVARDHGFGRKSEEGILSHSQDSESWPIAYYAMSKWLNNYEYRTHIFWWTFLLAGTLALIIAFLTVSYQAIKAARTNPADALRYE